MDHRGTLPHTKVFGISIPEKHRGLRHGIRRFLPGQAQVRKAACVQAARKYKRPRAPSAPFFVPAGLAEMPEDQVLGRSRGAVVYVIINGRLNEERNWVPLKAKAILSRSVSPGLNHMMWTTLELTATNVQLASAQLQYAAIPFGYPAAMPFDFRAQTTRPLFRYGYDCARAGRLWISSQRAGACGTPAASTMSRTLAPT
jgi:hypothetical protein